MTDAYPAKPKRKVTCYPPRAKPVRRPPTPDVVAYVRMLKSRLWWGVTLAALAKAEGISLPYLGNIRSGQKYAQVKWPNGKSGDMPAWRKKQILAARRVARKKLDEAVEKILRAADKQAAGGELPRNEKGQIVGNVRGTSMTASQEQQQEATT